MFQYIYTALLYCAQPLILLRLWYRSWKNSAYRQRIAERYGFYGTLTKPKKNGILLHAVSVGELMASASLINILLERYPNLDITVTTVTVTGSDRVKKLFGDKVHHVYLPFDLPDAMSRFVSFIQPQVCIVIETEIWPNLCNQLHLRNISFIIANGRLSARSTKRYHYVKAGLQAVFKQISMIAAQDIHSAERYKELGFPNERLTIMGNLKYDLQLDDSLTDKVQALKNEWNLNDRKIWIAASTHQGEDEIILQAHQVLLKQFPDLLLILVPRHPERFNQVAEQIEKRQFTYIRRSNRVTPTQHTQVILGDTMGELMLFYGISDIAFIGGSLVEVGGHNPLEALAFKLPIISGEFVSNFLDIYNQLKAYQGVEFVSNSPYVIANTIRKIVLQPKLANTLGKNGFKILQQNKGALERFLTMLKPYLKENL